MSSGYFITGTDTGVGKTFVSCLLVRDFVQQGLRTVGMKPVAAGCEAIDGRLVSEDVANLLAAGNVSVSVEEINPYAFAPPLAPHIAAQQAGRIIEFAPVLKKFADLQAKADMVVVEGVGGFRVPLDDTLDTADLAVALQLPVILVVGMRLGCLNHALLTSDAILRTGLPFAGWIANKVDPHMAAFEENLDALRSRIPAPHIATLPFFANGDWQMARLQKFRELTI